MENLSREDLLGRSTPPGTMSRRGFFGTTAKIGLGTVTLGLAPGESLGANERPTLGLIGAGGRGRGVMGIFSKLGVPCISVCDVSEANLKRGIEAASPGAEGTIEWREVIDRKDIDIVLIATPDHWHCPMLVAAVEADKDVYCEKPMSHSIEEGAETVRKVRATKRIVQIGMQRRSSEAIRKAKALVDEGALGPVYLVQAQWNWNISKPLDNSPFPHKIDWERFRGPKSTMAYQPMYVRYWRYFWDFSGGNCTDQGTHLMDVVRWLMGSGAPRSATCGGAVYAMRGAETPDVFSAVLEYSTYMATWTLNYASALNDSWSIAFHGRQAVMLLDDAGYRVVKGRETLHEFKGGIPTDPHVQNLIDCVKSREEPNAPVEVGHLAVCGPHLANVALRNRTRAVLDDEASRATF
ncbi:MAG: Gfo/Idh/MocA family oxidoreductase [Planctomycetes bacterium]|nr:Gfo/Idh/MocA family oxidoreductase [Planctomycetota bacterium]